MNLIVGTYEPGDMRKIFVGIQQQYFPTEHRAITQGFPETLDIPFRFYGSWIRLRAKVLRVILYRTGLLVEVRTDDGPLKNWENFYIWVSFQRKQSGILTPEMQNHIRQVFRSRTIESDAEPFQWHNLEIVEHRKTERFVWDPSQVTLLKVDMRPSRKLPGIEVYEILKSEPVMNANMLDFLLKNQDLIPGDWKFYLGIFFWGTIYRHEGRLCVRYICWNWDVEEWSAWIKYLDEEWAMDEAATCLI